MLLILDTNVLFTKNDSEVINPALLPKLHECRKYTTFEVCIPRICLREVVVQKCIFANSHLKSAAQSLRVISGLTGRPAEALNPEAAIKLGIQRRLVQWCKQERVRLLRISYDRVQWDRLTAAALWHLPPFSPAEVKGEKGFKDSLVLETVATACENESNTVVFITGDELLRDSAKNRLGGTKRFDVYDSLEEWLNRLKLQHEKKSAAFADMLLKKATKQFFTPDNPECVYLKFGIGDRIYKDFAINLSDDPFIHPMNFLVTTPPELSALSANYPSLTGSPFMRKWIALSRDAITIKRPAFLKYDTSSGYHWRSDVVFAKLYEPDNQTGFSSFDYIRIATFSVFWACKLSSSFDLTDSVVEQITLESSKAELANDSLLKQFRLPSSAEVFQAKMARLGDPSQKGTQSQETSGS